MNKVWLYPVKFIENATILFYANSIWYKFSNFFQEISISTSHIQISWIWRN